MIRHLEHNHVEIFEDFLRESHGLDQSDDVNPLMKKPKKRNMKQKGSTDPSDRTCKFIINPSKARRLAQFTINSFKDKIEVIFIPQKFVDYYF